MTEPASTDAETLLQQATDHHVAGRLAEAGTLYQQVLALSPDHPVALHRLGVLLLQAGQAGAAAGLFGRVVAMDPGAWRSHASLGQALSALGRFAEALPAFRRTLELNPASFEACMGLGAAFEELGRPEEALGAFRAAMALRPEAAEPAGRAGDALLALGRRGEAVEAYRGALALDPGQAAFLNNLGIALQDLGRAGEAVAAFREALAQRVDEPMAHANLGNALVLDRQAEKALEILEAACRRWPGEAALAYNLGIAAFAAGAFPRAEAAFRAAVDLQPAHTAARNNLGNTLQAMGRFPEALEVYREALRLDPDYVDTYSNASAAARTLGFLDEALAHLRQAIALRPEFQAGHANLGNVLKDMGRVDEALACFRRALELDPGDAVTHSNLVYSAAFDPSFDAAAILEGARAWDRRHAAGLADALPPPPNDPDPHRRLRVGYLSPCFRDHVLVYFLTPLLAHHDRSAFEITGYSLAKRPDAHTLRLSGLMDHFRDVSRLDDAQLAARIREDRIDILVDLTMHMSDGRPLAFARKPAPVQVAWLAYPGTTGLAAMDYRLTDPNLDPEGRDGDYSERSVRLPDVFSCYDPLVTRPVPGPLPARTNGHVTFGCFNNFCKVNPAVESLWCRVMAAVPGSRLLVLAQPGGHRRALLARMAAGGVAEDRIAFVGFQPRSGYLELHQQVDIGLDTFPYNGHTTSLDALWMGVPVVTLRGRTVVGRTCWTLLCNLGLRDLAAETEDDYVAIVAALAGDLPRLEELRRTLRERMAASPLMDGRRFAGSMEAAFRAMWTAWCEGRN
jgi:predicted O-linked N-acetylglucosamine transferase (SPINDLY family)